MVYGFVEFVIVEITEHNIMYTLYLHTFTYIYTFIGINVFGRLVKLTLEKHFLFLMENRV